MNGKKESTTQPNSKADYRIISDGGSKGNGSKMAEAYASFQIATRTGRQVTYRIELDKGTTNNQAEYHALLAALQELIRRIRATKRDTLEFTVKAYSDSNLLVNQLNGTYRVRSPNLKPLHKRATGLINHFNRVTVVHTPRQNIYAVLGH